jgi:hypothetical protein
MNDKILFISRNVRLNGCTSFTTESTKDTERGREKDREKGKGKR